MDAGEKEPGEASPSAPLKRIALGSQVSSAPEYLRRRSNQEAVVGPLFSDWSCRLGGPARSAS